MVAVLQFRRVFLASSLVGAGWCLPHSALAFGCVPLVGLLLRLFTASYFFFFPSGGVSVLLLYVCSLHLLGVFSSSCSIAGESLSSGIASSIAPDPSRVLGTGLEVVPTPASARCSSCCFNSCKERRAAGSSGWALSGTIPTQVQSAPSSGAAFFLLLSPPRVFRHRAGGLPNSSLCQGF